MRTFSFLFIAALSQAFTVGQDKSIHRLVIHSSSSVTIYGKTNVNKYQCAILRYAESDTLLFTGERGRGAAYFKKGQARLSATSFDCKMKQITRDFAETIKAKEHPYIKIGFVSFERMPKYETTEEKFNGSLTVTLADATVPALVHCSIVKDDKGMIHLRGKHDFKFSDFKLVAPTKMMGLIKVHEAIEVEFHLVLVRVSS